MVEAYVKVSYADADHQRQQAVRNFLSQWIQIQVQGPVPVPISDLSSRFSFNSHRWTFFVTLLVAIELDS